MDEVVEIIQEVGESSKVLACRPARQVQPHHQAVGSRGRVATHARRAACTSQPGAAAVPAPLDRRVVAIAEDEDLVGRKPACLEHTGFTARAQELHRQLFG
jgi:hypothetical protein